MWLWADSPSLKRKRNPCRFILVDVDQGDPFPELIQQHRPLAIWRSRQEGRYHLLYRSARPKGNGDWEALGCFGQLRSARGYAILWGLDAYTGLLDALLGDGKEPGTFRDGVFNPPANPLPRVARSHAQPAASPSPSRPPPGHPQAPQPPPAGVPKGRRNNWLFDALRSRAYQQDKGEYEAGCYAEVSEKSLELADSLQDLDDDPNVARTAKSVARYCWEHPAFGRKGHAYDHCPERQRNRAYIGIKKKMQALLERNVLISKLHFKDGWTQRAISTHLELSTRQVRRVLARWLDIEENAAKLKELSRQTGDQGGQDSPPTGHEPISPPPTGGVTVPGLQSVATVSTVGGPGGMKSPQSTETEGRGNETQGWLPGIGDAAAGGAAVEREVWPGRDRRRGGGERGQGPPVDERLEGGGAEDALRGHSVEPVPEYQPGPEVGEGGPHGGVVHADQDPVREPETFGLGADRSLGVGDGPALWGGAGGAPG